MLCCREREREKWKKSRCKTQCCWPFPGEGLFVVAKKLDGLELEGGRAVDDFPPPGCSLPVLDNDTTTRTHLSSRPVFANCTQKEEQITERVQNTLRASSLCVKKACRLPDFCSCFSYLHTGMCTRKGNCICAVARPLIHSYIKHVRSAWPRFLLLPPKAGDLHGESISPSAADSAFSLSLLCFSSS